MCLNSSSPTLQCYIPITDNRACRNFGSLFVNTVKRKKGLKKEIVPIAVFPMIFITDCLKNWKNLWVVFCSWSFRITLKAYNYPSRPYDISLNNFQSPNSQLKFQDKREKILIFQICFK